MNEKLKNRSQEQVVLLVTEKDGTDPKVVTGLNESGTPKSAEPKKENELEFLKIDKHGDVLENFMRQSKDPTHFRFFKVTLNAIDNIANVLSTMLKAPENPSNKKFMEEIRVLPETFAKKPYRAIDESCVDWKQFKNLGVTGKTVKMKEACNFLQASFTV